MATSAAVSTVWILLRDHNVYPLGLEPMFPALAIGALCLMVDRIVRRTATR